MNELLLKIWFYNLQIPNSKKIELLNNGILPCEFWNYSIKEYVNLGIDLLKAEEIHSSKIPHNFNKISDYIIREKIQFILYNDLSYPDRLRYIFNPPVGLFIKGIMPDLSNSLAIVGARKASDYGRTVAYKFAYELAARGIVIISGMAKGIDSSAHKGSLDAKGKTVAVTGSGLHHIYPSCNYNLFNEIIGNGCVITEYMPEVRPFSSNFPERNRIISGLAKNVLIVEAGERSGSLITANLALEQGKDVFAVPGNIFSPNSIGTNKLIAEGAKLISSIDDILEEFCLSYENKSLENLDESENAVFSLIKTGGVTLEYIIDNLNLDLNSVLSTLSRLECKNVVKKTYGNFYIIC
jgi:DNA processing protein